ncbi:uncharacterized protein SAPINGB_P000934 [Magnusiomyces paraingens]|uniref:Pre-mRNA-processing protein 45 n=1 Tax=Magnusiomyces paraingens TaxID=2606893 RepID=A0A5E8B350_9ASCO|nr:uncharacterized protein SAPINGB_P000934 [Saprochaete ingens]VVT45874.1 unnamed protein product [Saprochaete ingens]
MASIDSYLPKPKNKSQNADQLNSSSNITIVSKLNNEQRELFAQTYSIPSYGHRTEFRTANGKKWRPQSVEDYGDGGAYPEIPVAQYPRNMGQPKDRNATSKQNKTLALTVNSEGNIDYSSIAKNGHSKSRIVQSSYSDLIPLRQRVQNGEVSLDQPDQDTVRETTEKTQLALQKILDSKISAEKPKTSVVAGSSTNSNATYVRYTPSSMMGESGGKSKQRIIKLVDVQNDPLAPPKFKHTKVVARPPSPPPPVLRSPPRKVTAEDQKNWYIPPSVSNWKNPKGFTIAIDKRMASDGRNIQTSTLSDNFAKLSEALAVADNKMRVEVSQRNAMKKKLQEKEEFERDERLRQLAHRAKAERDQTISNKGRNQRKRDDSDTSDESDNEKERRRTPSPTLRKEMHTTRKNSYNERSRSPSESPRSKSQSPYRRYERSERQRHTRRDKRDSSDEESGYSNEEDDRHYRGRSYQRRSSESQSRSRSRSRTPESDAESNRYHKSRTKRRYSDSDQSNDEEPNFRQREFESKKSRRESNFEMPDERRRRIIREEKLEDEKRKMRMSRMGTERRIKSMISDKDRDISERVALGVARPTQVSTGESQFDSRLMGRVSVSRNFNEDQPYESSLFRSSEAIQSIYRPRGTKGATGLGGLNDNDEDNEMRRITGENRFESHGNVKNSFTGSESTEAKEGPVEFEKDSDPFGVSKMIREVQEEKMKNKRQN